MRQFVTLSKTHPMNVNHFKIVLYNVWAVCQNLALWQNVGYCLALMTQEDKESS